MLEYLSRLTTAEDLMMAIVHVTGILLGAWCVWWAKVVPARVREARLRDELKLARMESEGREQILHSWEQFAHDLMACIDGETPDRARQEALDRLNAMARAHLCSRRSEDLN